MAQDSGTREMNDGNFRQSNLLIVEKKRKLVASEEFKAEEGVLSIPPEDAPNNCKSKLIQLDTNLYPLQNVAGASVACPTIFSAAVSAGKRRNSRRASPTSSSDSRSGYPIARETTNRCWSRRPRIPSLSSSRSTLVSRRPSWSFQSAVLTPT